MKAVIEGLLFVSGDEGLTIEEICNVLDSNIDDIKASIKELYNDYQSKDRGISIEFLGNHYKLTTKPEHKNYYQKLVQDEQNKNLSDSALEVLSIIAYNEPLSRANVDEIRGVNSSYVIRKLLLNGLIEDKGRSEAPGRPILYGVTPKFLDYFGLGSTSDLPPLEVHETTSNNDENLFNTKYKEKN